MLLASQYHQSFWSNSSTVEYIFASTRMVDEYESNYFKVFLSATRNCKDIEEAFTVSLVHLNNSPSQRPRRSKTIQFILIKRKSLPSNYKLVLKAIRPINQTTYANTIKDSFSNLSGMADTLVMEQPTQLRTLGFQDIFFLKMFNCW